MSLLIRCDRCRKDAKYPREVCVRMANVHPESQHVSPESFHVCVDCWLGIKNYMSLGADEAVAESQNAGNGVPK